MSLRRTMVVLAAVALVLPGLAAADSVTTHPYQGITRIDRTETSPRAENIHVIEIDLAASGIGFKVTPPGGTRDTVRQTTLDYLNQQNAQVAINGHFFVPFPTTDTDVNDVGLAASMGNVFSPFEPQPVASGFADQSYAIIQYAPALNIDSTNHASIVHRDTSYSDNKHVLESVTLWNALSGSAQIITNGVKTIPTYSGTAMGGLNPINGYSDSYSWYSLAKARTAIGLTQDNNTLVLFTVDQAGGSGGMAVGEVADMLISYGVYNALNLDGGGSTTLAMQDPVTQIGSIVNVSADNPLGRAVGTNLAIFAVTPEPATMALLACGVAALLAARRRNLLWRSAARSALFVAIAACLALPGVLMAGSTTTQPFLGITRIDRTETSPRAENMHIIKVDLTAPGIGFAVTPPGGTRDTVCQTDSSCPSGGARASMNDDPRACKHAPYMLSPQRRDGM